MEHAAIVYLEKLQHLNLQGATNEVLEETAHTLQLLGKLYIEQSFPKEATNTLVECMNIYHRLATRDEVKYHPALNNAFVEILQHYLDHNMIDDYPEEILQIALTPPKVSHPSVYKILSHFGRTMDTPNAHIYLNIALQEFRKLTTADPNTYKVMLAITIQYIGDLKMEEADLTAAEKCYEEAIEIYESLLAADAEYYMKNLAIVLDQLAELKVKKKQPRIALDLFFRSSTLWEALEKIKPDTYMVELARSCHECAILLYNEFRNLPQAILYMEKATKAWQRVETLFPEEYAPESIKSHQAFEKFTAHSSQIFIH